MHRAVTIVSIVLILVGALWALQGAGYVGGSFMTGANEWLYIGIATAAIGVIGVLLGRRSR